MVTQRRRLRRKQPIVSHPFATHSPNADLTSSQAITSKSIMTSTIILPTITLTTSSDNNNQVSQSVVSAPTQNIIAPVGLGVSTTPTRYHDGSCSHLTVTRLYTNDHVCSVCYQFGGFGWLYRCTQDRDLLIEHDIECGIEVVSHLAYHSTVSKEGKKVKNSMNGCWSSILDE